MIEELRRHGYKLSAGTLYPMLHGMESRGLLRSKRVRMGRRERRVYRATAAANFESLRLSLVVLATVPSVLAGVVLMLFVSRTGATVDGRTEVFGGVQAGDRVVANATDAIRNAASVTAQAK